jgi:hypothetical protein
MDFLKTSDKFDLNTQATPYSAGASVYPLPTRNIYELFGDVGQDLFRHGLAELTPNIPLSNSDPSNPEVGLQRLSLFNETANFPYDSYSSVAAKEDPVIFGFDIFIRAQESPLFSSSLQDSVSTFLASTVVTGNDEMNARGQVWQDFKSAFFDFFRNETLYDTPFTAGGAANNDNTSNSRFYYYLKKVSGLSNLVEQNSGDTAKSFIDYGKDMIKLEFTEDVTLRIGRLAQLYKSLYWSRLNGKTMIPENLLRFDCDIIISEVRNFAKVKKSLSSGKDLDIIRDNVNRYVYTLYECQLFFDKMGHPDEIDLGGPKDMFTGYNIGFNYKFSTCRLDVFDYNINSPTYDSYKPINNATYNPYSMASLDKFLYPTSTVNSSSQSSTGISTPVPGTEPQILIDVITYNDYGSNPNSTNAVTNGTLSTSDAASAVAGAESNTLNILQQNLQSGWSDENNDITSSGGVYKNVSDIKLALTDTEADEFKSSQSLSTTTNPQTIDGLPTSIPSQGGGTTVVSDSRWGRPAILSNVNQSGNDNTNAKASQLNDEISSDGMGNQVSTSWLNDNSIGARFAKRIVSIGVGAANQIIAQRAALLSKTIGQISNSIVSPIPPPTNVYDPNSGSIVSVLVRRAFSNFVGESISSLFGGGN